MSSTQSPEAVSRTAAGDGVDGTLDGKEAAEVGAVTASTGKTRSAATGPAVTTFSESLDNLIDNSQKEKVSTELEIANAKIVAEEERVAASVQVAEIKFEKGINPCAKKLYDDVHGMIEYAKENNLSEIVSYSLSRKGITIHNKEEFTKDGGITKKFRGDKQLNAFFTTLRRYYFKAVRSKDATNTYVHPFFEKENSDSFYHIKRKQWGKTAERDEDYGTPEVVSKISENPLRLDRVNVMASEFSKRPSAAVSPAAAAVIEAPNKRQKTGSIPRPSLLTATTSPTELAPAAAAAAAAAAATAEPSLTPTPMLAPAPTDHVAETMERTTGSTVHQAKSNLQRKIAPGSPSPSSAARVEETTATAAVEPATVATGAMPSEQQHDSSNTAGEASASERKFNSIIDKSTDEYNAVTNQTKQNKMRRMIRAVRHLPHLKEKDDAFVKDVIHRRMETFVLQRKLQRRFPELFAAGMTTTTEVAAAEIGTSIAGGSSTATTTSGTGAVGTATAATAEIGRTLTGGSSTATATAGTGTGKSTVEASTMNMEATRNVTEHLLTDSDTPDLQHPEGQQKASDTLPVETTIGSNQCSKSNIEDAIQHASQTVGQQISSLVETFQTGVSSISQECTKEIARQKEELTKLRLQLLESQQREQATKDRTQERDVALQKLSQARAKCERLEKLHDEAMEKSRSAQRDEIVRLRSNHQTEMDDIRKRHDDNLKKMQINHKQELDNLRSDHSESIEQHREEQVKLLADNTKTMEQLVVTRGKLETVRSEKKELEAANAATNKELEAANSAAKNISAELDDVIRRHNEVQSYATQEYNQHQITTSQRDEWKRRFEELQGEHQRVLRERDDLQEELNGRGTAVDL